MSAELLRQAAARIRARASTTFIERAVGDYLATFNDGLPDDVAVNEGDCECSNCEFAWKVAHQILEHGHY